MGRARRARSAPPRARRQSSLAVDSAYKPYSNQNVKQDFGLPIPRHAVRGTRVAYFHPRKGKWFSATITNKTNFERFFGRSQARKIDIRYFDPNKGTRYSTVFSENFAKRVRFLPSDAHWKKLEKAHPRYEKDVSTGGWMDSQKYLTSGKSWTKANFSGKSDVFFKQ